MIKKKQKSVKGISLIVLVITIIVIIILAGAVIISLINSNVINNANEAAFKSNVDQYKSELSLWVAKQYTDTQGSFDKTTADYTGQQAKDAKIVSFKAGDESKFKIVDGELVIVTEATSEKEQTWFAMASTSSNNSGGSTPTQSEVTTPTVTPVDEATTGTPLTASASVSGKAYSYNNPIIPTGFYPVNTADASWDLENGVPKGWDNGLVIKDAAGNEFVWIPVDGINVRYEKWCITGIAFTSTWDDTLPTGIVTEQSRIVKYRGFYVGRYEASYASGKVESKKGKTVLKSITYQTCKNYALAMSSAYGYTSVKTGLLTGTQWDTLTAWIQNSDKDVINSGAYGNCSNVIAPANVTGAKTLQVSGFSEYWKAKNIYDIAGNVFEYISEIPGNNSFYTCRGGSYSENGSLANRSQGYISNTYAYIGFRVALFII